MEEPVDAMTEEGDRMLLPRWNDVVCLWMSPVGGDALHQDHSKTHQRVVAQKRVGQLFAVYSSETRHL